jgi:hypothetical protein
MTDTPSEAKVASGRPEIAPSLRHNAGRPIVLKLKKRKGKKRKYRYSKGLRDFQLAEGRLAKVTKTAALSLSKGVTEYDRQRRKSASKKRDGALRDFLPNVGLAMSEAIEEASDIPRDVAKMLNTKTSRRLLRAQLKLASDSLRLFSL